MVSAFSAANVGVGDAYTAVAFITPPPAHVHSHPRHAAAIALNEVLQRLQLVKDSLTQLQQHVDDLSDQVGHHVVQTNSGESAAVTFGRTLFDCSGRQSASAGRLYRLLRLKLKLKLGLVVLAFSRAQQVN